MPRPVITFVLGLLYLGSSAWLLTGCDRGERAQFLLEAKRADASDAAMEKAREIVERRLGAAGSSGATVVRQHPNRLLVTLGRGEDAEQVKGLVGRSARLDFRLVDLSVTLDQLDSGRARPGTRILAFANDGTNGRIAVRGRPIVTGSMIVDAQPGFDGAGRPAVTLSFDAPGSRRFARATRENVGRPFAIVLDGVVISAPAIEEPILGGQAQISGNFTVESANQLAIALRSGALPVDLVVVEERVLAQ
jgi:preprotein translocase subunit SecD